VTTDKKSLAKDKSKPEKNTWNTAVFVQEWTIEDMLAPDDNDLLDSDDCELLGSGDLIAEDSLVG
jgi:hypothetical protein